MKYYNVLAYFSLGYENCPFTKEALAIRRIFSLVDMITKAKFSNSPSDF